LVVGYHDVKRFRPIPRKPNRKIDSVDDFGPDRATRAVLAGGGRN
jgi:hypothetical protein